MFVANEMVPTDDEVILCVRYTQSLTWVMGILLVLLGTACIASPDFLIQRGKYLRAIVCAMGGTVLLVIGLDVLFTRHIVFFQDRVLKEWHLFGKRSILYSRANLVWASRLNGPRKGKTYLIKEVGTSGRVPLLQMPIYYVAHCVTPETEKQIDAVLSYLVGVESDSRVSEKRRSFCRSLLPKEVLS